MDITRGEQVEAELDAMITRRDTERQVWVAEDGYAYAPPVKVEGRGVHS